MNFRADEPWHSRCLLFRKSPQGPHDLRGESIVNLECVDQREYARLIVYCCLQDDLPGTIRVDTSALPAVHASAAAIRLTHPEYRIVTMLVLILPSFEMISSPMIFCAFCPSGVPKLLTSSVTAVLTTVTPTPTPRKLA
jgi:hypothetical protein